MILDGTIDIEMGASTKTYDREKAVDFSLVYFTSETTFLVNTASGINNFDDLKGKRVAVGEGTTNMRLLKDLAVSGKLNLKKILPFDNHNLALWALVSGKAEAYCADRVLLTTKRL
jgi:ABC-type amino acid transport substrate-binding protein